MRVTWTATSPATGRLEAQRESGETELATRFEELRRRGEGYLEVSRGDADYPYVALGFRDGHAVAHWCDRPEAESLVHGDGSVPSEASVDVLVIDDFAVFTGAFVMTLDHAWDLLHEFVRTGSIGARKMTPL